MRKVISILNRPFPAHLALSYRLQITLAFSIFIILFLLYFEPFPVHLENSLEKLVVVLGYGAISFVMLGLDMVVGPTVFKDRIESGRWKVYMHVGVTLWLFVKTTAVIMVYNYLLGFMQFSVDGFFSILGRVVGITALPTALAVVILYNFELRINLESARKLNEAVSAPYIEDNDSAQLITLVDSNQKQILTLTSSQIIMIRSADNYVEVYWRIANNIRKDLIRHTLQAVEDQISGQANLFRCHRTAIINLSKIRRVEGNSTGCSLVLEDIDHTIPVARSKGADLRQALLNQPIRNV